MREHHHFAEATRFLEFPDQADAHLLGHPHCRFVATVPGVPAHPRDLTDHECINWKPAADAPPYRWEFTEDGRDFTVNVDARVVTTDPVLNLTLAVAGVGLMIDIDRTVRGGLESGELVSVLDDYSAPFPGFFLYFPRRRQRPAALRAFIDYVREQVRT